jgi:radical SAM superfamily enzyme YgiQ (UPF0313 family)
MNKKILLLNPPAKKPCSRDGYCSHLIKGIYLWPPGELVYQSGFLAERFQIQVLDAIATRLSPQKAWQVITRFNPEAVLSLIGQVCWEEDREFLRRLKNNGHPAIIVSGDLSEFRPADFLEENPWLDAVLTDPLSPALVQYLEGRRGTIPGLTYRLDKTIIPGPLLTDSQPFSVPHPHYHLFPIKKYGLPFGLGGDWGLTLSGFGCPYKCSFCNLGNFRFRTRDPDNFIDELRYLDSLGIKNLLFREAGSTNEPGYLDNLCGRMISEGMRFNWICPSRLDTVSPGLLRKMKAAGCFLIMFGVESGNPALRRSSKSGLEMSNPEIISLFQACRELGIHTLAHFILGLPGEDSGAVRETIDFAVNSGCDYASFNIFAHRPGISVSSSPLNSLPPFQLKKWEAAAYRKFYFRPRFLWGHIFDFFSLRRPGRLILGALHFLRNFISAVI